VRTNHNRHDGRRAAIISCAIRQLGNGYDQVSVGSIARELNVSKGVLTYHFPHKRQLMEAVVEEIILAYAAYIEQQGQDTSESIVARLQTYISTTLGYMYEHNEELVALLEIGDHLRGGNGQLYGRPFQDEALNVLRTILEHGQENGEFGSFDVATMALVIKGALDAHLRSWHDTDRAAVDLETVIDQLNNILVKAVRK
jgi:TetR/AcrR family transcriptional regulator, transcriptional repressor of bet genes